MDSYSGILYRQIVSSLEKFNPLNRFRSNNSIHEVEIAMIIQNHLPSTHLKDMIIAETILVNTVSWLSPSTLG